MNILAFVCQAARLYQYLISVSNSNSLQKNITQKKKKKTDKADSSNLGATINMFLIRSQIIKFINIPFIVQQLLRPPIE